MKADVEKTLQGLMNAINLIENEEDKQTVQAVVNEIANVMMCEEEDDNGEEE